MKEKHGVEHWQLMAICLIRREEPSPLSKSKIKFNKACHDKFEQCKYI